MSYSDLPSAVTEAHLHKPGNPGSGNAKSLAGIVTTMILSAQAKKKLRGRLSQHFLPKSVSKFFLGTFHSGMFPKGLFRC